MKRLLSLIVLSLSLIVSTSSFAKPDLVKYIDIAGVRVYQDSEIGNKWYLSPAPVAVKFVRDQPDYTLDLHRYMGRSGTGDSGEFWARGVFNVGIQKKYPLKIIKQIKKDLKAIVKKNGYKKLKLDNMPIAGSRMRVLFGDFDQSWSEYSRWSGKKIVMPLNQNLSQIIWEAADSGQTLISIEVEELVRGVINRKQFDKTPPKELGKDEKSLESNFFEKELSINSTISVELDIEKYPEKFIRTDLSGEMSRGYTQVDVFCFDFLEKTIPDLYVIFVELAIHTEGRNLIEKLRFDSKSDYRQRIRFPLSKSLDKPYGFRLTYVYTDGRKELGKWKNKYGETMLDITSYKNLSLEDPEG